MYMYVHVYTMCHNARYCIIIISCQWPRNERHFYMFKVKAIKEAESRSKESAVLPRRHCVHHAVRSQHGTA